jgi:tRNA pseudouridine55 synthase
MILGTAKKFTGEITQIPPVFSALKIDGKKAYEYARKNEKVKKPERLIKIYSFDIEKIELPLVYFRVKCSKGTYIRSLAYDFGKALKSGAYLSSLCRTAIGNYRVEDALTVAEFKNHFSKNP